MSIYISFVVFVNTLVGFLGGIISQWKYIFQVLYFWITNFYRYYNFAAVSLKWWCHKQTIHVMKLCNPWNIYVTKWSFDILFDLLTGVRGVNRQIQLMNPQCGDGRSGHQSGGFSCPVPGCPAKRIRDRPQLKVHWLEKHEEIVPVYFCSVCTNSFKRKSNLFQHFRIKHGQHISDAVGRVESRPNPAYHSPGSFTLDGILTHLLTFT